MQSFLAQESWDSGVESYPLAGGEKTINYEGSRNLFSNIQSKSEMSICTHRSLPKRHIASLTVGFSSSKLLPLLLFPLCCLSQLASHFFVVVGC